MARVFQALRGPPCGLRIQPVRWLARARLGLDPGDPELLKRYETWRGLDSFMVALATDGLTRLFGVPGKTASAVRRLGMAAVQRTPLLKSCFMDEARGVSGDLPELLKA